MRDRFLMDSHKLLWHPDRVAEWRRGKRIVPIHIDVGLSKGCNIRCHYCFGHLQGNLYEEGRDVYFPREPLLDYVRSAGEVGVRSMAFVGEAEPTLNPALDEAIVEGSRAGVDIALATNGILFVPSRENLSHLTWLRFNISAASPESYQRLHRSKDFDKAVDSIAQSVEVKERYGLETTVGMQMVLTPKNFPEAVPLTKLGRKLGVDYFVIKQCSDTLTSALGVFDKLEDARKAYKPVLEEAESLGTPDYDVIVKWSKILGTEQSYDNCLGVPFLLYSSGDGKIFPCGMFFLEKYWDKFLMGDLTKQSFRDIITSERYWEVVERVRDMGTGGCYAGCRTHAINEFLWDYVHKTPKEVRELKKDIKSKPVPPHVNFI